MFDRLVDLFIQFLDLFRFWNVLMDYEVGVQMRLGRFKRIVGPGLHWVLPFHVDQVIYDNYTPVTINLPPQSLTTKDGITLTCGAVVTYSIDDIKRYLLEIEGGREVVVDSVLGIIANSVLDNEWRTVTQPEFIAEVRTKVRRRAGKWGVKIDDLQWSDLCRAKTLRLMASTAAGL